MNTVFIAGHARLPSGMAAKSIYETLTITAEIDKKYGVIVSTSCTLATMHGREFVEHLLKGYSLQDGIDKPVKEVRKHYLGKAGSAIESALKDLYKQYEAYYSAQE
ncbi:DUF3870 domain-containing protein [Virgibacillus sp. W0181]|uniref:DUF3870 domain-containing protein n=1 Tax=Virgibacillus sp. W0181 TaxID=3391581 RepID=UPI003F475064